MAERRLEPADADFEGTELEWQQLSDYKQLSLVADAIHRRRQGLAKFWEAESIRKRDLIRLLKKLSFKHVLQMYHSSRMRCDRWDELVVTGPALGV